MRIFPALVIACFFAAFAPAAEPAPKFDYVTLKGRVLWPEAKALPELEPIAVFTDKDYFGKQLMPNSPLVNAKSRGLKNVVVWLRPDSDDRAATFPQAKIKPALAKPEPIVLTVGVTGGHFEPRILVARAGDKAMFLNNTTVTINVQYDSEAETFNVVVPAEKATTPQKALEASRTPVYYKDNIHPWMSGRIRVFDHPYFALTDKDGNFEIKDAPVGKWRIVYQHEGGYHKGKEGLLGFPVELKGDKKTMEMDAVKLELPKP